MHTFLLPFFFFFFAVMLNGLSEKGTTQNLLVKNSIHMYFRLKITEVLRKQLDNNFRLMGLPNKNVLYLIITCI